MPPPSTYPQPRHASVTAKRLGGGGGLAPCLLSEGMHALGLHGARSTLSLMGAVGLLAGIQRSSVSLVVIMMEGTGRADLLLPIIAATVAGRYAAGHVNDGLYEMALEVRRKEVA